MVGGEGGVETRLILPFPLNLFPARVMYLFQLVSKRSYARALSGGSGCEAVDLGCGGYKLTCDYGDSSYSSSANKVPRDICTTVYIYYFLIRQNQTIQTKIPPPRPYKHSYKLKHTQIKALTQVKHRKHSTHKIVSHPGYERSPVL